jgi:hypothetical protein
MAEPTPAGAVEQLLAEYRTYLRSERGLAPLSVLRYLGTARLFLSGLEQPLEATLQDLSAGQVTSFGGGWPPPGLGGQVADHGGAVAAGFLERRRPHSARAGHGGAVGGRVETECAAPRDRWGAGGCDAGRL